MKRVKEPKDPLTIHEDESSTLRPTHTLLHCS